MFFIILFSLVINSSAQTYCVGDNFTFNAQNYIAGEVQWQYSFDGDYWFDYIGETELTHSIIGETPIYVRLKIIDPECLPPYYTDSAFINVLPDPTVAYAGEDQLGIVGTSTNLNANTAEIGTGFWSITSGSGGSINDNYNPTTSFTGVAGTTYELRWVIFNDCGFTQDFVSIGFVDNSFVCGNDLFDIRDGQSYPTVELDGKCWMAANLNIGTMLTGAVNATDNSVIEKFCYADNSSNCDTYGALYQWNEAMNYFTTQSSQGICPEGWHIPSDAEIKSLEISLGMTPTDANLENTWRGTVEEIGTIMKAGGSSGFEILLSGVRNSSGGFMYLEGLGGYEFGYIWSSTEGSNTAFAYRRCWQSGHAGVGRYDTFNKLYSYPIRCVKD
ncbi:MAG TPA: fibrobacter succinogenes major paralogous domain-containing protein [Bacteroidales bacterium]|nr:fibrobacter succinogenes major paralogous domain-containing protein [Bacteroidales bacterium]